MTVADYHTTAAIAARALERGARKLPGTRVEWKASGNCSSPQTVERFARVSWQTQPDVAGSFLRSVQQQFPGATLVGTTEPRGMSSDVVVRDGRIPIWLIAEVPCRKCDNCLKRRARAWSIRAQQEFRVAQRTWFGTLTVSPQAMSAALNHARARVAANEILDAATGEFLKEDYERLPENERVAHLHRYFSPRITRYLKRVRKGALPEYLWPKAAIASSLIGPYKIYGRFFEAWATHFRFLCVAELGSENGRLHYHMLVHERVGSDPIRRVLLSNQWRSEGLGYTDFHLCNTASQASYLCKYLTKSLLVRVRASKNYGEGPRPNDIVQLLACKYDSRGAQQMYRGTEESGTEGCEINSTSEASPLSCADCQSKSG